MRWRPHSRAELERALEEYAVFQDGTKVRRYGAPEATGSAPGADYEHQWERVMRQNTEIDRRMERLLRREHRCYAPLCWRVLDLYYRHGLCYENRGWEIAAARIGLPHGDRELDRRHFEKLVDIAVDQLWRAHSDR